MADFTTKAPEQPHRTLAPPGKPRGVRGKPAQVLAARRGGKAATRRFTRHRLTGRRPGFLSSRCGRGVSVAVCLVVALVGGVRGQQAPADVSSASDEIIRFRSGVDVVNVTATVSDRQGHFVSGLTSNDFRLYEDGRPQAITHFSAERVPVSLGICLDTSGSMAGDKIRAAESALARFLYDLLDARDEVFLYQIGNDPMLLQGWTTDHRLISHAIGRITPVGGTALYDTLAAAIPLAQQGRHAKKAIVVISDGNDTASRISLQEVKARIRESDVLVYAVGIDGRGEPPIFRQPPVRVPVPMPFPPRGRGGWLSPPPPPRLPGRMWSRGPVGERVNDAALRSMTDDSGGRTEIIRGAHDLDPATAGIADELSRQYFFGYVSSAPRDGRWHAIRVEVPNASYHVRARRGYAAS